MSMKTEIYMEFLNYTELNNRINMPRFHDLYGKQIPFTKEEETEKDAEEAQFRKDSEATAYIRARQYPPLGEQLDMLFHDMTAGNGTKDGEWYKAISKVKSDNPKPE